MDAHTAVNGEPHSAQERVRRALLDDIDRLPAGARLPSQNTLVKRLGVSRATVQKALDDLREEGLITSAQGSGSFVAERAPLEPEAAEFLPATLALPRILETAFQEPRLTVDYYGLTAETLYTALGPLLAGARVEGARRPESIAVRLLLPSPEAKLALPSNTADPSDPRPLHRLRELISAHALALVNSVSSLRDFKFVPEVSVEVKVLAVTPLTKVYIINGRHALQGFYEVQSRPVSYQGEKFVINDVLGLEAPMMPVDPEFVPTLTSWFDSLWSSVAADYTLGE